MTNNQDYIIVSTPFGSSFSLTSQLSRNSLERQLSELINEWLELGIVDQLVLPIIQLIHRDQAIG